MRPRSTLSSRSSSSLSNDSPPGNYAPPVPEKPSKGSKFYTRQPTRRFKAEREKLYNSTPPAKLIDLLIKEEFEVKETRRLLNAALSQIDSPSQRVITAEIELAQDIKMSQTAADAEEQITKAQMEAETYKLQLQNAQKESERTRLVIQQLEAQKEHAEKSAIKAKELARRLKEEKAVVVAREDGRREGFDEGLRRGRLLAIAQQELAFPQEEPITAFIEEQEDEPTRHRSSRPKQTERRPRRPKEEVVTAFIEEQEDEPTRHRSSRRRESERSERRPRRTQEDVVTAFIEEQADEPTRHRSSRRGESERSEHRPRRRHSSPRSSEPRRSSTRGTRTEPAPSSVPSTQSERHRRVSSPVVPVRSPSSRNELVSHAPVNPTEPVQSQSMPPVQAVRPQPMTPVQPQPMPQVQSIQPEPPVVVSNTNQAPSAISQNPRLGQHESILPSSLSRNVPEPVDNGTLRDPEAQARTGPGPPTMAVQYIRMPPPPRTIPAAQQPQPAPMPLSFIPSDTSQPRIQVARSSPDIMNSPASTSMTGLSSQLGSHLLSFPGGSILGRRELSVIPEDVSNSSPRTRTPLDAWPSQPEPSLDRRRSVEEWRKSTELAVPSTGFASSSVSPATSAGLPNTQYLRPPGSGNNSLDLQRRPSNSSGHSIEFEIIPPSRPSSLVLGDENQNSGFLSPHHAPPHIPPASDANEPPVVPTRTGYTPPGSDPYAAQRDVPVFEPHQLPPGFVPQLMTHRDGSVVDLASGKVMSTPSIGGSPWKPASSSRQQTPSIPHSHPFPPPPAIAGPSSVMDDLTSTFGSFSLAPSAQSQTRKGILVNGTQRPPYPSVFPTSQPPAGITFSRSVGDIPGVAMTSPDSNMSSPRRRRMSLHAGKTPAINYQTLPAYAGSRSSTPAVISPLVFARPPPRSDTSSVASHRSYGPGNGFIPPMMAMPEPNLTSNPPPFVPPMMMPEPTIPGRFPDHDSDTESYVPDPQTMNNTKLNSRNGGGPWSSPMAMTMPYT